MNKLSLLLIFSLLVAVINCQTLVLAALYVGNNGCGQVNVSSYVNTGACITNLGNIGVTVTLNGNSGSLNTFTGANALLCTGTAASTTQFNLGQCFTFNGVSAQIFSSSTPLWSTTSLSTNNAQNCNNVFATTAALITAGANQGCALTSCTCAFGNCISTSCQTSQPGAPGGAITSTVYSDNRCQTAVGFSGLSATGCYLSNNVTQTSVSNTCNGNTITSSTYTNNNCNGSPLTTTNITGGCTQVASGLPLWYQIGCGSTCFHRDTEIIYKDEKLDIEAVKKGEHPSCTVPHVYTAPGVKIISSCSEVPLRLSTEHLVYTQKGLVEAQTVQVGDILYQDMGETAECKVISAEKEYSPSDSYFGLNCEESVVLANGFKTSTFGKLHFVPSLWMRIMTPLVGVKAASAWGEYFSHMAQRYKLF